MVLMARRGQFFVIGALLIAALITGYVVLDVGGIQTPQTQTPRQLFDRTMTEFPAAVNHITAAGPLAEAMQRRLTSYLAFQDNRFAGKGLTAQMHAAVGVPSDDNVTVVVANFRGRNATGVNVTVDGTTQTAGTVTDGSSARLTFTGVSSSAEGRIVLQGGETFNQSFPVSTGRQTALLHLKIAGESQNWVDTRTY
jgi:hypothetical protein